MMRKSIYLILGFVLSILSMQAQITPTAPQKTGIQTRRPSETLDINGTVRLRDLPVANSGYTYKGSLHRQALFQPTHTVTVDENGVLGRSDLVKSGNNWIFLPPLRLPTNPDEASASLLNPFVSYSSGSEWYTVSTPSWARNQLAFSPKSEVVYTYTQFFAKSPSASDDIGYIGYTGYNVNMENADFYVLYYDKDVFTDVYFGSYGRLYYKIKPGAVVTSKTYMTIAAQIPHK